MTSDTSLITHSRAAVPSTLKMEALGSSEVFMNTYQATRRHIVEQWFPSCGTGTPGSMRRTDCGYAKTILVMAENTKKMS
jgi:hypothetical protein